MSQEAAPYLHAVVHEVLRLHPPVAQLPLQGCVRQKFGSIPIEPGTPVDVSLALCQVRIALVSCCVGI